MGALGHREIGLHFILLGQDFAVFSALAFRALFFASSPPVFAVGCRVYDSFSPGSVLSYLRRLWLLREWEGREGRGWFHSRGPLRLNFFLYKIMSTYVGKDRGLCTGRGTMHTICNVEHGSM